MVTKFILDQFFVFYNSTRRNTYGPTLTYSSLTDTPLTDMFLMPCFGQISDSSINQVMQVLAQQWVLYFNKLGSNSLGFTTFPQAFSNFALSYVNLKGY